jgi:hypothetical protein
MTCIFVRALHCIKKLLCQLASVRTRSYIWQELQFKYIRSDDSQLGPDARSTDMEIAYSTSTVWTNAYHGPDARSSDMEIECWRLTVRTAIPLGPDARSLIWKLLAADVRLSGRLCLTIGCENFNYSQVHELFAINGLQVRGRSHRELRFCKQNLNPN